MLASRGLDEANFSPPTLNEGVPRMVQGGSWGAPRNARRGHGKRSFKILFYVRASDALPLRLRGPSARPANFAGTPEPLFFYLFFDPSDTGGSIGVKKIGDVARHEIHTI